AAAGAALGLLLSGTLSRFLVAMLGTEGNPLFLDLDPDPRMLTFTAGLASLTCLLFGLMPALRATRISPGDAMKTSSRSLTGSRELFWLAAGVGRIPGRALSRSPGRSAPVFRQPAESARRGRRFPFSPPLRMHIPTRLFRS